jgi:hypothetical protein
VKLRDSQLETMEVGKIQVVEKKWERGWQLLRTDTKEQQPFRLGKVKLLIWVNPIREVLKFGRHSHIFTKHTCTIVLDNAILKDK